MPSQVQSADVSLLRLRQTYRAGIELVIYIGYIMWLLIVVGVLVWNICGLASDGNRVCSELEKLSPRVYLVFTDLQFLQVHNLFSGDFCIFVRFDGLWVKHGKSLVNTDGNHNTYSYSQKKLVMDNNHWTSIQKIKLNATQVYYGYNFNAVNKTILSYLALMYCTLTV